MARTGRGGERPHCAEFRHLRAANSAASRTMPRADGTITSRPLRSLLAWESVSELAHKAIRRGSRMVQFVGNARGRGGLWHRGSCRIGRVKALRDLRYGSQTVVEGTYLRFVRFEYRGMAGRAMAGENCTGSSVNRGWCARRLARVVDDVVRWLRQPIDWSCEFRNARWSERLGRIWYDERQFRRKRIGGVAQGQGA